jgi:alkylation response protein AidB-like acyl-CoA dehydrogenase
MSTIIVLEGYTQCPNVRITCFRKHRVQSFAAHRHCSAARTFGLLGFTNNDLSRHLRDAVGMRIAGGTSDIQRINIFNQMRRRIAASHLPPVGAE